MPFLLDTFFVTFKNISALMQYFSSSQTTAKSKWNCSHFAVGEPIAQT